jgi:hypothetical protein
MNPSPEDEVKKRMDSIRQQLGIPKRIFEGASAFQSTIAEQSATRRAMLEGLARMYLVAHPELTVDDVTLVEQQLGTRTIWYFAKKSDFSRIT